jgi:peptide methionine sulfoxide reductase MsrB
MARAAPNLSLVITLVSGLVIMCSGIVVLMEYAKVQLKKHGKVQELKKTGPTGPYADRIRDLTATQYAVTQGTQDDDPNFGKYCDTTDPGLYLDIVSNEVLFSSRDKLPTSIGYAEFARPVDEALLVEEPEKANGEDRIRVKSKKANTRLGWKAPDAEGRMRYFLNSSALRFVPGADLEKEGLADSRKFLEAQ